eukprot:jgi/Bigna1/73060/fgenesh1_pg.22_\
MALGTTRDRCQQTTLFGFWSTIFLMVATNDQYSSHTSWASSCSREGAKGLRWMAAWKPARHSSVSKRRNKNVEQHRQQQLGRIYHVLTSDGLLRLRAGCSSNSERIVSTKHKISTTNTSTTPGISEQHKPASQRKRRRVLEGATGERRGVKGMEPDNDDSVSSKGTKEGEKQWSFGQRHSFSNGTDDVAEESQQQQLILGGVDYSKFDHAYTDDLAMDPDDHDERIRQYQFRAKMGRPIYTTSEEKSPPAEIAAAAAQGGDLPPELEEDIKNARSYGEQENEEPRSTLSKDKIPKLTNAGIEKLRKKMRSQATQMHSSDPEYPFKDMETYTSPASCNSTGRYIVGKDGRLPKELIERITNPCSRGSDGEQGERVGNDPRRGRMEYDENGVSFAEIGECCHWVVCSLAYSNKALMITMKKEEDEEGDKESVSGRRTPTSECDHSEDDEEEEEEEDGDNCKEEENCDYQQGEGQPYSMRGGDHTSGVPYDLLLKEGTLAGDYDQFIQQCKDDNVEEIIIPSEYDEVVGYRQYNFHSGFFVFGFITIILAGGSESNDVESWWRGQPKGKGRGGSDGANSDEDGGSHDDRGAERSQTSNNNRRKDNRRALKKPGYGPFAKRYRFQ